MPYPYTGDCPEESEINQEKVIKVIKIKLAKKEKKIDVIIKI